LDGSKTQLHAVIFPGFPAYTIQTIQRSKPYPVLLGNSEHLSSEQQEGHSAMALKYESSYGNEAPISEGFDSLSALYYWKYIQNVPGRDVTSLRSGDIIDISEFLPVTVDHVHFKQRDVESTCE
jgi:hypothetical protein